MALQSTFTILFWISRNRLKNGKAPIYIRVTINGQRAEFSAQREVSPLDWDPKAQLATGRINEAKLINNHLSLIKAKLLSCHSRLEARGSAVTIDVLKKEYFGVIERPRMLMEMGKIQYHPKAPEGIPKMEVQAFRYRYKRAGFQIHYRF